MQLVLGDGSWVLAPTGHKRGDVASPPLFMFLNWSCVLAPIGHIGDVFNINISLLERSRRLFLGD